MKHKTAVPDPRTLKAVCWHCLLRHGDSEWSDNCQQVKSGKHRMMDSFVYAGVIVTDAFGIKGTGINGIRRHFSESCWDESAFEITTQISNEDAIAINDGRARLILKVEPLNVVRSEPVQDEAQQKAKTS